MTDKFDLMTKARECSDGLSPYTSVIDKLWITSCELKNGNSKDAEIQIKSVRDSLKELDESPYVSPNDVWEASHLIDAIERDALTEPAGSLTTALTIGEALGEIQVGFLWSFVKCMNNIGNTEVAI